MSPVHYCPSHSSSFHSLSLTVFVEGEFANVCAVTDEVVAEGHAIAENGSVTIFLYRISNAINFPLNKLCTFTPTESGPASVQRDTHCASRVCKCFFTVTWREKGKKELLSTALTMQTFSLSALQRNGHHRHHRRCILQLSPSLSLFYYTMARHLYVIYQLIYIEHSDS